MSGSILYSASQGDLFFPARDLSRFPAQRPKSDAELCAWLSLLAYCDQGTNFAFDREKIAVHLAPLGFAPVIYAETTDATNKGGTHCFLVLDREAQAQDKLMVVAFRGTNKDDPRNILDDAEVELVSWRGPGKVSAGFNKAFEEVAKDVLPLVESADCRLLFTGHSLGAALATLLAAVRTPDALYTIGSPRSGDQEFANALIAVNKLRYVDCCDLVTTLPPPLLLGHVHAGDPIYIDRNRRITSNPGEAAIASDRFRAGFSYTVRYAWKPGNVRIRGLADHAPINYAAAIAANQT